MWSAALASGASPRGYGLEAHSWHFSPKVVSLDAAAAVENHQALRSQGLNLLSHSFMCSKHKQRFLIAEQGVNLKLANGQIQVPGIEPETFSVLG